MKICLVVAGEISQLGGLETHVVEISNRYAQMHDVTVVGHRNLSPHLSSCITHVDIDLSKSRYNLRNLFRLYQVIKRGRFDIIHAHANKAVSIVSRLRHFLKFNFVATLHGQKGNLSAYRKADHVISVSHRIAKGLPPGGYTVVYNGIQQDLLAADGPDLAGFGKILPDDFVFCAIGRLVEVKGFDVLLKAFSGVDAKLLIVGDGPDRGKLEALSSSLMLGDRVFFTGHQQHVQSLIRKVDAVVISSRREGFPYVFAETLLNKKPVLSTDVSDIKRLMPDEYVVPVEDVDALHEGLELMKGRRPDLSKDFTACFDFAEHNLRFEAMIEKTFDVYRSLLPNHCDIKKAGKI